MSELNNEQLDPNDPAPVGIPAMDIDADIALASYMRRKIIAANPDDPKLLLAALDGLSKDALKQKSISSKENIASADRSLALEISKANDALTANKDPFTAKSGLPIKSALEAVKAKRPEGPVTDLQVTEENLSQEMDELTYEDIMSNEGPKPITK